MERETVTALTVGQLRSAIQGLPDSVEVVIQTDGWYDNVKAVIVPSTKTHHNDYVALTLVPASVDADDPTHGDWDNFQFGMTEPAAIIRPVGGEAC